MSNGATYTLGNVPTPVLLASDPLSGLAAPCKGVRAAGTPRRRVSSRTPPRSPTRRATCACGHGTYRVVYRFDGFLGR